MNVSPRKIRIGIVDDHPLYREGVAATLKAEPDFDVVGVGANGGDALSIARSQRPDLIVIDLNMRDGGVPLVGRLQQAVPQLKIVFLTVSEDESHVQQALQAGAHGYVLKMASGRDLVSALRTVGNGECYVMPELAAKLLTQINNRSRVPKAPVDGIECLSVREESILKLVSNGATNKEIARALDISEKTVKHYMTTIMQKLHVRNRVEAASLMIQRGRDAERSLGK